MHLIKKEYLNTNKKTVDVFETFGGFRDALMIELDQHLAVDVSVRDIDELIAKYNAEYEPEGVKLTVQLNLSRFTMTATV